NPKARVLGTGSVAIRILATPVVTVLGLLHAFASRVFSRIRIWRLDSNSIHPTASAATRFFCGFQVSEAELQGDLAHAVGLAVGDDCGGTGQRGGDTASRMCCNYGTSNKAHVLWFCRSGRL